MANRTNLSRFLLRAAALLLVAGLAGAGSLAAQRAPETTELSIVVLDPATGRTLARVAPGRRVKIEEGQSAVLRVEATTGGGSQTQPSTRFMVLSGGERIRLSRTTTGNAEALLEALRADHPVDAEVLTLVGFEAGNLGFGAVAIEVAKASRISVGALEIEVWDPFRKETIARVKPGQTLTMEPGQRVQLRMVAVATDGVTRRSPATLFSLPMGTEYLTLESSNAAQGWVNVEGREGRRGTTRVAYELSGDLNLGRGMSPKGEIRVLLSDSYDSIGASTKPEELVTLLYRGILLREPEPGIIEARARVIRDGGLKGLQQQAREIADSPESLSKLKPNGDVADRLEALYRHLLGLQPSEIPAGERSTYSELLKRKQIAGVVEGLIASDRFLYRHGLYETVEGSVDARRPRVQRRQ